MRIRRKEFNRQKLHKPKIVTHADVTDIKTGKSQKEKNKCRLQNSQIWKSIRCHRKEKYVYAFFV